MALQVEYNGSLYHGFQKQSSTPHTVQAHLEKAISFVANSDTCLVCAGRTDTGVHATLQWVHFDVQVTRPIKAWVEGVNTKLPDGIRIQQAVEVPLAFHARFSALSRTYQYALVQGRVRPAILAANVTWVSKPLKIDLMQEAGQILVGEHDFSSFRASQCQAKSPVRRIQHLQFFQQGPFVVMEVRANAFLHNMVRNIVGALLEIGRGGKNQQWLKDLLIAKNRSCAPATAPPFGLYLVGVEYPVEFSLPTDIVRPLFLRTE